MSTPEAYAGFINKLTAYCHRVTPSGFLVDGPLTESYWSTQLRLVALNLEAYGYDQSGAQELAKEIRKEWLKNRTPYFTIKLMAAIKHRLSSEAQVDPAFLRANYRGRDALPASVDDIAYVNVRKSSNKVRQDSGSRKWKAPREDTAAILKWTEGDALKLAQEQFRVLAPHIVVVGGKTGAIAASRIFDVPVEYCREAIARDGARIYSVPSPSRTKYAKMADAIERIVQGWNSRQIAA